MEKPQLVVVVEKAVHIVDGLMLKFYERENHQYFF